MKILYINGSRIPTERAHGLQIMKMCEFFASLELKTQNSKFTIELWMPRRFNYVKKDPFEYYGIERNFKIKKFFCVDFIPFSKIFGPAALWITELSFLFSIFLSFWKISQNVIYTRDKFVAFFLSFFWNNIFFEAHDVPAGIFFSRFKKIRGVIAITQNLKDEFVSRGVSPEKIIVAPDGVDLEEFDIAETKEECRKKLSLPQDKKIVLYAGHLYDWKGTNVLLNAAKMFQVSGFRFQNIIFFFVGGTAKDINQWSIVNGQLSNVRFVGHRPHEEIPYWLNAADVLVLPNSAKYGISKYWTSPLKLFEYMVSGRPIVASDLPSIREILSEKNAKLIAPDDAEALASAIAYMLNNDPEAGRISAQAKEDVKSYTWEKRAESIWRFFQEK